MTNPAPQLKLPAAILFDHDGTLVDTEPLWESAKQKICAEHGATWTAQDTADVLGQSILITLERLQEVGVDLPLAEIEKKLIAYTQAEIDNAAYDFLPGIEPLLQELKEAGIPCAIVTNATSSVAEKTAAKAPGVFSALVGDQQTTEPKPAPQPYLMAAQLLGVDPADCIAIEDSPSGATSATRAGMKVIIVPGELQVPENLGDARIKHQELTLARILEVYKS